MNSIAKEQNNVSQRTLRRNIFSMIWPATIESALQMMVGIVATAMVGQIGATAIGAVGLGSRVAHIVWAIFSAVGTGATVFVARAIGAKDLEFAKGIALQALVLGIALVSLVTLLAFTFASEILLWFGAEEALFNAGLRYLRLVVWGMPFMAVMQIVGAVLRGAGNTRTPMVIALIVNIINITLNYILIFGRLGFPALGIMGAAASAIISQGIGSFVALWVIYRPTSVVPLCQLDKFSVDWVNIKRLLKVGAPVAGESLFWQTATILLMKVIVSFGTTALAAHQLGLTAESLSYMPSVGFSIAATALVGQSLGMNDAQLAERYVREIRKWGLFFTTIAAAALFFLSRQILGVLTNDVAVIELGRYYLMLMAVAQFPQQLSSVMIGTLRGAGNTKTPMIIAGLGLWLIRLPLGYLLGIVLGYGVVGVWVAMTLDLFVRFLLILQRFLTGNWKDQTNFQ